MSKVRHYCFTSFNLAIEPDYSKIIYYIAGMEMCKETFRPHLQGYVEFTSPQRMTGAKKILGDNSIHLEIRRGTQEEAIAYCQKEDKSPTIYGIPTKSGRRNDLKKAIEESKDVNEFMDKEPQLYCSYRQGIKDIYSRKLQVSVPLVRDVEVIVYSGPTGTGKTYKAITENPDAYILVCTKDLWFDGYIGQSTLILDEYMGQIPYRYLLRLLDKYQMQLPIKGGFTHAAWSKVIIITNASCSGVWYTHENDVSHLDRRIKQWVMMDKVYTN